MIERPYICKQCFKQEVVTNMKDKAPICCGESMDMDMGNYTGALINVEGGTKKTQLEGKYGKQAKNIKE